MTELAAEATFGEFARIGGFKASYVTALRQAGRLVLTEDGKRVRVAESLELIAATRDPARAHVAARHAAARVAAAAKSDDAPDAEQAAPGAAEEDEEAAAGTPYSSHRAERERWLALGAKRDYEISMRDLIPAKELEAALAQIATVLRKDLEHLPDVLAPQIAPLSDEQKIRALLADTVERALDEVARQFATLARRELHG